MKSKKAKANSAAKTDGVSAAPQQGSGESSTTAVLSNLPFVSVGDKVSEIRCESFLAINFSSTVSCGSSR